MSHITTIKTKVKFLDEGILREVLTGMQQTFPGLRLEQTPTATDERQITVRYQPIEKYSRWQKTGNLRFIQKNGEWEMQGDPYMVREEFAAVTERVLVGYQQAALQRVLIRNRYTSQAHELSPGCVTLHARRF
jgi:hypothetical protein